MRVNGREYRAVWWERGSVVVIDQTRLPGRFVLKRLRNHRATAEAIRSMVVRGAGTIGATAAYGMAQAFAEGVDLDEAYRRLLETRPTAVDLKHAIDRVRGCRSGAEALEEAHRIADEFAARGKKIGEVGARLVRSGCRVLTHCNAGWLALVDWGSAPAPLYVAHRRGRRVFVWVDETRPRCQGAALTSWEFLQEGIEHRVIVDNAAGYFMRRGEVDLCIVGADRIAANGDVANKIGTYEKAVLARENNIPFYVAAPTSTIDWKCARGDEIPIEERDESEVLCVGGCRVAARGARAANPAFDVTPARYVTGIITERGIYRPKELRRLWKR